MECKRVDINNLIVNDEHKEQFLSISASFGLYKDIANIIYSYIYNFTDYDVIYQKECTFPIRIVYLTNCIFYVVYDNNNFHTYSLYLIKDDNVHVMPISNPSNVKMLLFAYNNEIYALRSYDLYQVIIDYDKCGVCNLQHLHNFDKDNIICGSAFNDPWRFVFDDNLIVEDRNDFIYAIQISNLLLGYVHAQLVFFSQIRQKNMSIEEYIVNNPSKIWSVVCHTTLNQRKKRRNKRKNRNPDKRIYKFVKNDRYYAYYSNKCLLCGSMNNNCSSRKLPSNMRIIRSYNKLYFKPGKQENMIKFKESVECVYELQLIRSDLAIYWADGLLKVIKLR